MKNRVIHALLNTQKGDLLVPSPLSKALILNECKAQSYLPHFACKKGI